MRVCQFRQDRIFCFCKSERPATILLYTIEKKMQVLFLLFPNIFLFMPNFFSAFLPDTVSFRLFPLLSFFSCAIKQHYEKSKNIYRRREEGKERKGKERKGRYSRDRFFQIREKPVSNLIIYLYCSAKILPTYTPLAEAWEREWVTPDPSPRAYRPGTQVLRFSSTFTFEL